MEKANVKIGDFIHIYHMFGNAEYRDSEGYVEDIDDIGLYGTWGNDILFFHDDWEIINN